MNTTAESLRDLVDGLFNILEEELWLLYELTRFSQDKAALLIKSDLEGLKDLLSAEEETIEKLRDREDERVGCTARLALMLGIAPEECRLKTLLERLDDETARRKLADVRQKLKHAARKMSLGNRKAEALASQKTGYADFLINVLYQNARQNGPELYDMQGKIDNKAEFGRHDYTV